MLQKLAVATGLKARGAQWDETVRGIGGGCYRTITPCMLHMLLATHSRFATCMIPVEPVLPVSGVVGFGRVYGIC